MAHNHYTHTEDLLDEVPLLSRRTRVIEFIRSTFKLIAGEHTHNQNSSEHNIAPETQRGLGFSACDPGLHAAVQANDKLAARRREEALMREYEATPIPQDS